MDTNPGSKPLQPPTATAGGEQAVLQEQILQMGTTQKDNVDEVIDLKETGDTVAKKPPTNPMMNYFVSPSPLMVSSMLLT